MSDLTRRIQRLDDDLMRRSAAIRSTQRDRTLIALTRAASLSRLWFLIAGALAAAGGERGRRAAIRGVSAIAIASVVANGPAKWLVRRHRPAGGERPPLVSMPPSTSFPSGHAASGFAFALAVGEELPALLPLLVPLAGAVAYSRVHVGVHHPSDVLAGIAIGLAAGAVASQIPVQRWISKARGHTSRVDPPDARGAFAQTPLWGEVEEHR
jgi:undecaprenyl-diphosphatase